MVFGDIEINLAESNCFDGINNLIESAIQAGKEPFAPKIMYIFWGVF